MPKVGISVESCIITQWHKQTGEKVKKGELLFSYETDKATADEEAKEDGELLEIFAQEGDEVPVLATVCVLGEPGEDISALIAQPAAETATAPSPQMKEQAQAAPAGMIGADNAVSGGEKVSPRARALAQRVGVDPRFLRGTGPEGRVIERDIRAATQGGAIYTGAALAGGAQAPGMIGTGIGGRITVADLEANPPPPQNDGVEVIRLSSVRRAIAKSMTHSLATMAQLTNNASFDASSILQYRAMLKAESDPALVGITLNDMLLYAVAKTLKNHRDLNAHLIGEELHRFAGVHLGVAVDTPRGLLVPTLFNADAMTLPALSAAAKKLIKDAQTGTTTPDAMRGGTFTVSNLGALGVESFTPVINPPQTGILGVCAIVQRIHVSDGLMRTYPAMGLSLTYDHRAVDGAPAARFLMELRENLENFTALLTR